MVRIAPVDLQFNPKTLWFDAGDFEIEPGKAVVVTTARGTEFGHLASDIFEASEEQVSSLKTALKPVLREAGADDEQKAEEMAQLSKDAMPAFREMAAELAPEMRPISVEYLLDGDKAIFYFESEERVDFRELVRKLAAEFHVRVDMRQIGVRDEARMVGGLGHCGQELCCKRLGGEFCPVSIRMAKEQDLSLNPQKISGVCGRLMCCLRYEFDAYKDFKSRAPKVGASINTPAGVAKVVDLDVPREIVTLRLEEEKPVKVPLSEFEPAEEGQNRPNTVGEDAWERANADEVFDGVSAALVSFSSKELTGKDKLAEPVAVSRKSKNEDVAESSSRKPRRRRSTKLQKDGSAVVEAQAKPAPLAGTKSAKEESRSGKAQKNAKQKQSGNKSSNKSKAKNASKTSAKANAVRPGQNSSALQRDKAQSSDAKKNNRRNADKATKSRTQEQSAAPKAASTHRRSRRRSHTSGKADGSNSAN